MKMQNADMEFVAFDAQDVIATSGPFGTTKVRFQGTIGNEYNDLYGGFDFGHTGNPSGEYQSPSKYFAYDYYDKPTKDNDGVYWQADSSAANINESNTKQGAYTLLSNYSDIVKWLQEMGYNPHQ